MIKKYLDENNWYSKPIDKKEIESKKKLLKSLALSHHSNEIIKFDYKIKILNDLCKDLDFVVYILAKGLYENLNLLDLVPVLKSHIKVKKKAIFLLKEDVNGYIKDYIFNVHEDLKRDKSLGLLLIGKSSKNLVYFNEILKNRDFINKIIEDKNIINYKVFSYILKEYSGDEEFSRKILLKKIHIEKEDYIHINKDLLKDVNFIKKVIKNEGYEFIYEIIDESLRERKDVIREVLKYHPFMKVKSYNIESDKVVGDITKYKKLQNIAYIYVQLFNNENFKSDENFIKMLKVLSFVAKTKYNESWEQDLVKPICHLIQSNLIHLSSYNKNLKSFLETKEGLEYLSFEINNIFSYNKFEKDKLAQLYNIYTKYVTKLNIEKEIKINTNKKLNKI